MIARPLRLHQSYDFTRVRREGRSWSTPLVVLAVLPNDLDHNRYGFAVSRRVGKAVQRNRIRRWLREAVRAAHPQLRQGYDIVLIARGGLADPAVRYEDVEQSVTTLFRRAKLLRSPDMSAPAVPPSH